MTRAPDLIGAAHRRLSATASIDELLAEVDLFLRELPRALREEIAPECRPTRIETQKDVSHWSRRLERYRMLGTGGQSCRGQRIIYLVMVGFVTGIALMPLDARRFHWTPPLQAVRRGAKCPCGCE